MVKLACRRSSFFHPIWRQKLIAEFVVMFIPDRTTIREIEGYLYRESLFLSMKSLSLLMTSWKETCFWLLSHSKTLEIEAYFRYF